MPNLPKRAWRATTKHSEDATRPWREEKPTLPGKPTSRKVSKTTKFAIAVVFFAMLVALFVWIAIPTPPRTAYVVLIGAKYAEDLDVPHNLYGWNSLQDLHKFALEKWRFLWWDKNLFQGGDLQALTVKSKPHWADELKKEHKEETLIVYLALHGGADGEGPYLIPDDYRIYLGPGEKQPADPLLRVSEVLKCFEQLPAGKKKLLILDATQVTVHWPLGMLHNDFARQLKELEERIKIPNLMILSASAPRQRSWVSEEWGETVFGHYVLEGLKGAADRDNNGYVTALELATYVHDSVRDWVLANRDEKQTPEFLVSEGTNPDRIQLVVVDKKAGADEKPSRQAPLASKDIQAALKSAWDEWGEVRKQSPAPYVYAPHLWRRYQDTLLRYEQVLRAGYPVNNALRTDLGRIQDEIAAARLLKGSALDKARQASLPMRLALPEPTAAQQSNASSKSLEEWWKGNKWDELTRLNRPARQALFEQFVQQAPRYLKENRTKVRSFLGALYSDGLRPAEAHFPLMLEQDLNDQPKPSDKLVQLALHVHLLAEKAAVAAEDTRAVANIGPVYSYTEQVSVWITDTVRQADKERRLGEDWLFGANEQAWAEAEKHLTEAKRLYDKAEQDAGILRDALNVRDEVLAALPYYSQWLAGRRLPPDRPEEEKNRKQKLELAEQLWKETHQLALRLNEPTVRLDEPQKNALLQELQKNGRLVRKEFGEIKNDFEESCKPPGNVRLQGPWHAMEAALSVPLIAPELRLELLDKSQRISKALQENFASGTLAAQPGDVDEGGARDNGFAEAAARRQGRMAVAILGQPWIDLEKKQKHAGMGYEDLQSKVVQVGERDWRKSLSEAGGELERLWQRLPQEVLEISDYLNNAEQWRVQPAAKYLDTLTTDLTQAEGPCRQMDGAAARLITPNPVLENRRLRLHNLLLRQAERAWHDHWWCTQAETQSAKDPYFVTAVNAYLDAAKDMVAQDVTNTDLKNLRQKLVESEREKLKPTRLTAKLLPSSPTALTTEQQFQLAWNVTADNVPEGVAMFRLNTEGSLEPKNPDDNYQTRQPRRLNGSVKEAGKREYLLKSPHILEAEENPPPTLSTEPAKATLVGLYRGQRIHQDAELRLHLGADTIVTKQPPPNDAAIAVQADEDIPRGAVAIILDYSGSMVEKVNDGGRRVTKIQAAQDALDQVLRGLGDGTILSVWVFGDQTDPSNTKEDERATHVRLIRRASSWNQSQRVDLMNQLHQLQPKNLTPLVEAMVRAKKELLASGKTKGLYKTILVLTDGYDTIYRGDLWPNHRQRALEIQQKMREEFNAKELKEEKVAIQMILFGENDTERGLAVEQFKDAVEGTMDGRGGWYDAKDRQKLDLQLLEAMRPRLRLYDSNGVQVLNMPPGGYKVTFRHESGLDWSKPLHPQTGALTKSIYQARVQNTSQDVKLDRGDWMLIRLRRDPNEPAGFHFERGLLSDQVGTGVPKCDKDSWRLAVLRNGHERGGGKSALRLLVSIEDWKNVVPERRDVLEQPAPGFKWFELHAGGEKRDPSQRIALRWQNVPYYPAHVWSLDVDRWPGDVTQPLLPLLDAWWVEDRMPNPDRTLSHQIGLHLEDEFRGREEILDGDHVVIENVAVEKHHGLGRAQPGDCLVVRLRHDLGKPVFIQLTGLEPIGEEHRFYAQAGKVTAIFRLVPGLAAQNSPFTLNLISLDAFKKKAERNGYHVGSRELKLQAPSYQDTGPQTVK
jgi:hypothetical protein